MGALILLVFFLAYILSVHLNKRWKSVDSILVLFSLTTLVCPAFYFSFLERSYSEYSLLVHNIISAVALSSFCGGSYLLGKYEINQSLPQIRRRTTFQWVYVFGTVLLLTVWFVLNFEHLPAFGWFSGKTISRPDTTNSVAVFYSMSSVLYYILPSFLLWYKDKLTDVQYGIILLLICIALSVGGHRSVLVFYLIFHLWFVWNRNALFYLTASTVGAVAFSWLNTVTVRGSYLSIQETLLKGIIRLFVEQGRGLPARYEMVENGHDFASSTTPIKSQVAAHYWSGSGGTMPTAFWGDIYVKWGSGEAVLSILIFTGVLYGLLHFVTAANQTLVFKWTVFCMILLVFQAEISFPSSCRLLLLLINFIMLDNILSKRSHPVKP